LYFSYNIVYCFLAKRVEYPALNIPMCCGTSRDGSELWALSAKRKTRINPEVPAHCRCNEFYWDLPLYIHDNRRKKEAEWYTMEGLIRRSRRRTLYRGSSTVYLSASFVDMCLNTANKSKPHLCPSLFWRKKLYNAVRSIASNRMAVLCERLMFNEQWIYSPCFIIKITRRRAR